MQILGLPEPVRAYLGGVKTQGMQAGMQIFTPLKPVSFPLFAYLSYLAYLL